MYIYIYTHTYLYICVWRERERDRYILRLRLTCSAYCLLRTSGLKSWDEHQLLEMLSDLCRSLPCSIMLSYMSLMRSCAVRRGRVPHAGPHLNESCVYIYIYIHIYIYISYIIYHISYI